MKKERSVDNFGLDLDLKRDPDFWSNTLNDPLNPTLVMAQILADRGIDVRISEGAVTLKGAPLPNYVEINGSPEAQKVLNVVRWLPELIVLSTDPNDPNLEEMIDVCSWDKNTRIRVRAFILQRSAKIQCGNSYGKRLTGEAEALLQDARLEPLTPEDLCVLLEPVVDRVLQDQETV